MFPNTRKIVAWAFVILVVLSALFGANSSEAQQLHESETELQVAAHVKRKQTCGLFRWQCSKRYFNFVFNTYNLNT